MACYLLPKNERTNLFCLLFYSSRKTNQICPFIFWENLPLVNLLFGFIWPLAILMFISRKTVKVHVQCYMQLHTARCSINLYQITMDLPPGASGVSKDPELIVCVKIQLKTCKIEKKNLWKCLFSVRFFQFYSI